MRVATKTVLRTTPDWVTVTPCRVRMRTGIGPELYIPWRGPLSGRRE